MALVTRHDAQAIRPSPTHPAAFAAPSKGGSCPICAGNQHINSHVGKTEHVARARRRLREGESQHHQIQARIKVAAGHVLSRGTWWDFSEFCTLF